MELSILVIDSNIDNYSRMKLEWEKRGIPSHNETSMQGAIARLEKETFFFLYINGDSIDYTLHLRLLRDVAQCPIYILNTSVTTHSLIEAYRNGADMYWFWRDEEVCAQIGVYIAERYHVRENRKPPKIIIVGELTVIPSYRQVLGNNTEIPFAKTEFDILMYLIANRGIVLTYRQISRKVGLGEYDEISPDSLFSIIKRMRKKLRNAACLHEYIVNVRGIGYRFPLVFLSGT